MPDVAIRNAVVTDVPAIVALLAVDELGALASAMSIRYRIYCAAFTAIDSDPNQQMLVSVLDDRVVGCLQIGERMIAFAMDAAQTRACRTVQLTTADKARLDAHRFYERLGFRASHEGMKLTL